MYQMGGNDPWNAQTAFLMHMAQEEARRAAAQQAASQGSSLLPKALGTTLSQLGGPLSLAASGYGSYTTGRSMGQQAEMLRPDSLHPAERERFAPQREMLARQGMMQAGMGAGSGALAGATTGSMIPGVGTLIGAILGGLLGGAGGVSGASEADSEEMQRLLGVEFLEKAGKAYTGAWKSVGRGAKRLAKKLNPF